MAPNSNTSDNDFFLPDFCGLRSVLAVMVLVELFAFVLTLASAPHSDDLWGTLALYSLFMQWVGLIGALLLCLARRPLSRLSDTVAGLIGYLLLLIALAVLSITAHVTMTMAGFPNTIESLTEFTLRNLAVGAIASALILRYFYVSYQWRKRTRAEARARLEALQARIRPHFLFNSINTVTSLIHDKPDEAEEALLDLADLFRASLREEQQFIPLAEELALTRRYLNMESLRLGDRLQLDWQIEQGCEHFQLPPLMLQPLVENAVYHGIEPRPEGGVVSIVAEYVDNCLKLTVINPLPQETGGHTGGSHIALDNIRDRLNSHYGEKARLMIEESESAFKVQLSLPSEKEGT